MGKAGSYDNNGRKDFAARVGSEEEQQAYFDALEERYRKQLETERIEREAREAEEVSDENGTVLRRPLVVGVVVYSACHSWSWCTVPCLFQAP